MKFIITHNKHNMFLHVKYIREYLYTINYKYIYNEYSRVRLPENIKNRIGWYHPVLKINWVGWLAIDLSFDNIQWLYTNACVNLHPQLIEWHLAWDHTKTFEWLYTCTHLGVRGNIFGVLSKAFGLFRDIYVIEVTQKSVLWIYERCDISEIKMDINANLNNLEYLYEKYKGVYVITPGLRKVI